MKNLFLSMLAATAMALTACSNDDNAIDEQPAEAGARTYAVNISAAMDDGQSQTRAVSFDNTSETAPTISATFKTDEKVYVYNVTKSALLEGSLSPSSISSDGKKCQLTGSLTGTVDANDELTLMYNLSETSTNYPVTGCDFDYYTKNDGTAGSIVDGGVAKGLTASFTDGTLTTSETATFELKQAIFRLKFADSEGKDISVKNLHITAASTCISVYFRPLAETSYGGSTVAVIPASATSDYLYVAFHIRQDATPCALNFEVTDAGGNLYTATKDAPSGGFKNGCYYYNTSPIKLTLKEAATKPTITWTYVEAEQSKEPNEYNGYIIRGPMVGDSRAPSEITISGNSYGYRFSMQFGATIHLDNLTAAYNVEDKNSTIYSSSSLTLDIQGTNDITCKYWTPAVSCGGTIKLMGNGTLKITQATSGAYGLYGENHDYKSCKADDALTQLAADGYTVSRTAMTSNDDDTYSITYTVKPTTGT